MKYKPQVLLSPPNAINPNFITVIGDVFEFVVFIEIKHRKSFVDKSINVIQPVEC